MPPPPPVTPSPHRFVIKKQPPVRRPTLDQDHAPRSSQFNATPRFTFSSTPRPTPSQNAPPSSTFAPRYLTPARPPQRFEEIDLDQSSEPQEDDEQQITEDLVDEDGGYTSVAESANSEIEERSLKRRRTSSSPMLLDEPREDENATTMIDSSPPPILSSPPARRPLTSTAPRFLVPTPTSPTTPQANSTFQRPPRFRPPDPSEQAQSIREPLPEQFSPHRRGQAYVPGGLAAEVRDWLINIESSVSRPVGSKEPWLVKLVVDEVSGGAESGMTLVRGRQIDVEGIIDNLGIVKMALAGEGASVGLQRAPKVEAGKKIGIKGPVWEISLDDEKWGVGTDWKVLLI